MLQIETTKEQYLWPCLPPFNKTSQVQPSIHPPSVLIIGKGVDQSTRFREGKCSETLDGRCLGRHATLSTEASTRVRKGKAFMHMIGNGGHGNDGHPAKDMSHAIDGRMEGWMLLKQNLPASESTLLDPDRSQYPDMAGRLHGIHG